MSCDRITEDSVEALVRAFYGKVRADPRLEPLFTKSLGRDWSRHIAMMCDFWSAAMRLSKRYRGDMLAAHRRVEGLHPALFSHWLALFEETVEEHFAGEPAAALRDRALKTARNLQLALFHQGNNASFVPGAGLEISFEGSRRPCARSAPASSDGNQPRPRNR